MTSGPVEAGERTAQNEAIFLENFLDEVRRRVRSNAQ
jgi:hypothetical protein